MEANTAIPPPPKFPIPLIPHPPQPQKAHRGTATYIHIGATNSHINSIVMPRLENLPAFSQVPSAVYSPIVSLKIFK